MELGVRPWAFRLEDITVPVHIWHGDADAFAPLEMGRYLASAIPNAPFTHYPGEGHMLIGSHLEEILGTLISQASVAHPGEPLSTAGR
jgi:pimeloyl-ACP methyl ester carboxylesterase